MSDGLSESSKRELLNHTAVEDVREPNYSKLSEALRPDEFTGDYVIEFNSFRAYDGDGNKRQIDWTTASVHSFLKDFDISGVQVLKVKSKKAVIAFV